MSDRRWSDAFFVLAEYGKWEGKGGVDFYNLRKPFTGYLFTIKAILPSIIIALVSFYHILKGISTCFFQIFL